MKIAIIGASGQVGSEFKRAQDAADLVLWSHKDLEICSKIAVGKKIAATDATVIVNMAAFHDTNTCEDEPANAFAVNAVGTYYVARACAQHHKKLVYASTDYVFGMETRRATPYTEHDPVGPLNVYGVTKVAGEEIVRANCPDHLIIRTSNLFGVDGESKTMCFPDMIIERARLGQPLKVVADQITSPTYTRDLVEKTLELLKANAVGTFHLCNSGQCSWYEFAAQTLNLAGMEHPLTAMSGADFPSPARRPKYSALASERLGKLGLAPMRPWHEALRAYLEEVGMRKKT